MARKLIAKAGLGEIFSTDDFFIDVAGRYKEASLYVLLIKCYVTLTEQIKENAMRFNLQVQFSASSPTGGTQ